MTQIKTCILKTDKFTLTIYIYILKWYKTVTSLNTRKAKRRSRDLILKGCREFKTLSGKSALNIVQLYHPKQLFGKFPGQGLKFILLITTAVQNIFKGTVFTILSILHLKLVINSTQQYTLNFKETVMTIFF